MPTVTINQQSIAIPEGTTIIQAAQQLGIEIPHYCYHPGLSTRRFLPDVSGGN